MLVPVLFIFNINDMPDLISSFICMYADDAKVFASSINQIALQNNRAILVEWSRIWQLRFNVEKCKVMQIGHHHHYHHHHHKNF